MFRAESLSSLDLGIAQSKRSMLLWNESLEYKTTQWQMFRAESPSSLDVGIAQSLNYLF